MFSIIVAAICIYAITDVNADLPNTSVKITEIQKGAPEDMVESIRGELYRHPIFIELKYPVLVGLKYKKTGFFRHQYRVEYMARASNCTAESRPTYEEVNSEACSGEGPGNFLYCTGRYNELFTMPLRPKRARLVALCSVAP